jgi:uncharacterized protein (UPF0335 family)
MNMAKALELAMTKAAALPEAAQEQLGRELLERIERFNEGMFNRPGLEAGGCQGPESVISLMMMTKALQLAMTKAADLPEAAQEQLGRELLERIERLNELRAAIEVGVRELDAGLGEELDIEELIGELNDEHAGRR